MDLKIIALEFVAGITPNSGEIAYDRPSSISLGEMLPNSFVWDY